MLKRLLALLALGFAANAGAFGLPAPYPVVEYVNEATGRYRLVAFTPLLDVGGEDGHWVRTGYVFTEYTFGSLGESPVCHFYNPVHGADYYTPRNAECDVLRQPGSGW